MPLLWRLTRLYKQGCIIVCLPFLACLSPDLNPRLSPLQEKLVRMLATCESMQLLCWRLTRLYEAGRATPGMAAMVKANNSLRGREVRGRRRSDGYLTLWQMLVSFLPGPGWRWEDAVMTPEVV